MCFTTIINRMRYLDALIKHKATGCPNNLSEKLKISERSVYNLIEQMKQLGAPIAYNNLAKTYYYETPGEFVFKFLPDEELNAIKGEANFTPLQNYFSASFYLCSLQVLS